MPSVESELALWRDPQLAILATSPRPAWLWRVDGSRMLWANAVGAALFGADDVAECISRRFDADSPAAAEVVRLAASLPDGGAPRLERLRGFGSGFNPALTCACTRIAVGDGTPAVLVAAAEPAGPTLPLAERARRLFADDGPAIAVFAPDGTLLHASAAAQSGLDGAASLAALGLAMAAAQALETGHASGLARCGGNTMDGYIEAIGADAGRVLVLNLPLRPGETAAPGPDSDTVAPTASLHEDAALPDPAAGAACQLPPAEPVSERRHPLRFVWQMDAAQRFVVGSDEFIALVGPRTTAAFGRQWSDIADELKLDPDSQVARAVASRETWSGVTVAWPIDESSERLPVELSGLPVFDRDRNFRGYRGFGVCRDVSRINQLMRSRRERPIGFMPLPEAAPDTDSATAPAPHDAPDAATPIPAGPLPTPTGVPRLDHAAPAIPPASANVVPFRSGATFEPKAPTLSAVERRAFSELAQELTARLRGTPDAPDAAAATDAAVESALAQEADKAADKVSEPANEAGEAASPSHQSEPAAVTTSYPAERVAAEPAAATGEAARQQPVLIEPSFLDRLPLGVLVYRHDTLLHANRPFLELTGYNSLNALAAAGGLGTLFAAPDANMETGTMADSGGSQSLSIRTQSGGTLPADGRLFSVPWNGASALALILANGPDIERRRNDENELRSAKAAIECELEAARTERDDTLRAAQQVDAAALKAKQDAEHELAALRRGHEAARTAAEHANTELDQVRQSAERDLQAARSEREDASRRLEDTERGLVQAKREAQRATATKGEFLSRISHEIRTPLNAISGFAEVVMAERFGPIGNERYREYIKDIHGAATHLGSLLSDLLDLTKVESGQLDLAFTNLGVNDVIAQCVGIMQPQANRARIIIRSSLTPGLPQVVADERSLRQIVLNLLANSIKLTGPGGQVIVSTALSDSGDVTVRVRDTGVGMSATDIEAALAPFRQSTTAAGSGSGSAGLALPLTKALTEANGAHFAIKSAPNAGTIAEVVFPPGRIAPH